MITLVAAGVYAGFQYAMPKLRYSAFSDRMNEAFPYFQKQDPEGVRKQVIEMAAEFDVTLTPEQVHVDNANGRLTIDLSYEKVVDLKFWQKTLTFTMHRVQPL
jgi:hypothetical protein